MTAPVKGDAKSRSEAKARSEAAAPLSGDDTRGTNRHSTQRARATLTTKATTKASDARAKKSNDNASTTKSEADRIRSQTVDAYGAAAQRPHDDLEHTVALS